MNKCNIVDFLAALVANKPHGVLEILDIKVIDEKIYFVGQTENREQFVLGNGEELLIQAHTVTRRTTLIIDFEILREEYDSHRYCAALLIELIRIASERQISKIQWKPPAAYVPVGMVSSFKGFGDLLDNKIWCIDLKKGTRWPVGIFKAGQIVIDRRFGHGGFLDPSNKNRPTISQISAKKTESLYWVLRTIDLASKSPCYLVTGERDKDILHAQVYYDDPADIKGDISAAFVVWTVFDNRAEGDLCTDVFTKILIDAVSRKVERIVFRKYSYELFSDAMCNNFRSSGFVKHDDLSVFQRKIDYGLFESSSNPNNPTPSTGESTKPDPHHF